MSEVNEQNQQAPRSEAHQVSWTCTACGESNTGKYCTECGEKKPDKREDDTILSSFSDFSTKENDENMKMDEYPAEDITRLQMSCSGNNDAPHGFSFKLSNYYSAGNITFSCECYTEDKVLIQLNDIPVDFTYMKKMQEIAAKHDFMKMKQRDFDNNEGDPEKSSIRLDLFRASGARENIKLRTGNSTDTCVDELLELFWGIVNTLMGGGGKLPLRAEDIIAISYGSRELPRHGRYELREQDDGKIMFSWPGKGGETGWDIYINTADIDHIYMDRLRGIVEQCGILDPKPGKLVSLSSDEKFNMFEEDLKPPPLEVHWKAVQLSYNQHNWNRDSWLRLSKPTNGSAELLEFLRDLAITHANVAHSEFSHRSGPTR